MDALVPMVVLGDEEVLEDGDMAPWCIAITINSRCRRSRCNNKSNAILGQPPSRRTEDQVLTEIGLPVDWPNTKGYICLVDRPNNGELDFTIRRLPDRST